MTAQPLAVHQLLAAAREWYDAGYCVIPSHEDGGKRPFGRWKDYQQQRPDWTEVDAWLSSGRYTGIGVLTGAASGNVEMLELEGPMDAAVERLGAVIAKARDFSEIGADDLLATIARGCVEQSAGGGLHLFVRITDGPAKGNTKLAHTGTGTARKVVSETRGEGGFVIVAPTPARNGHPDGAAYLFVNGGHPSKTVRVTAEDRDILHEVFRLALDEADDEPAPEPQQPRTATAYDGVSAFDDYRSRTSWRDILEPAGWTWSHRDGDRDYWVRPGKKKADGHSASTIEDGPLVNFSTSVDWPTEKGLSKGHVYALLHHDGDLSTAARALADAGYGDAPARAGLPVWDVAEDGTPTPLTGEQADLHQLAVRQKYAELRVLDDARAMLAAAKAGDAPALESVTLRDFLAQPDAPVEYRIDGLWPADGRVLLAAAAKSGKTTMIGANLLPSLVDGRPFLGRHQAAPVDGTVVVLNMEVSESTMRRWMRDAGIGDLDRIHVANMRGKASAIGLGTPVGRRRFATWLSDHGCSCVLLDPLAPLLASLGLDENSNADVATFFSWWGEAMELAGVREDLVSHHTGHAGQRSRGASRLLDEPDAVWTLTREDDDDTGEFSRLDPVRYLSAFGRDVDMAPEALSYDSATRGLSLTGKGKAEMKGDRDADALLEVFSDGVPRSVKRIADDCVFGRNKAEPIAKRLISTGRLEPAGTTSNGYRTYLPSDLIEGM